MSSKFPFYNRKSELDDLKNLFDNTVVRKKSNLCLLIKGKEGVGKSRLVEELFKTITKEVDIISLIPNFRPEKNIIEFTCTENSRPYAPFIRIAESVKSRDKLFNAIIKAVRIVTAFFNINEVLRSLEEFVDAVKNDDNEEEIKKKEIKIHNSYVKFINKSSSKTPLVIYIKQSQFIDEYSLKLIRRLTDQSNPMWGAIILEEDTGDMREDIYNLINKLVVERRISVLHISALSKGFPAELLNERFGEGFINPEENDILYAISEGRPGKLIDFIEKRCFPEGWIFNRNEKWQKTEGFLEKIKPAEQKLIELIISLFEDNELSESEYRLIQKMRNLWGLSKTMVSFNTNMVVEIMDAGYKILLNLGPGIVSKNSFVVADESNRRFILEYLPVEENFPETILRRDISHKFLLEAREIKSSKNGLFFIWDYYESKKTREAFIGKQELKIAKIIQKFKSLASALSELHNQNITHGYIRPESIIESDENRYLLASFHSEIFKNQRIAQLLNSKERLNYLSPEILKGGETDIQGDIYSFGVLFYEELANHLPYYGRTKTELLNSINNDEVAFDSHLSVFISPDLKKVIKKCLSSNPEDRFKNAIELQNELNKISSEIVTQPTITEPKQEIKAKQSNKKWKIAAVIAFLIIITAGAFFGLTNNQTQEIRDAIVLDISKNSTIDGVFDAELLEYLLTYDLLQSSPKLITNKSDFQSFFSRNNIPAIHAKVSLETKGFSYKINVRVRNNLSKKERKKQFEAQHQVELLHRDMFAISEFITDSTRTNNYSLTGQWEAFSDFYNGEKAWASLNKNDAKRYFQNAFQRDPNFLLAKLRLAEVLFFEGNDFDARVLTENILEKSSSLSKVDSIKTLALFNRLSGNLFEAVKNYQTLISRTPYSKDLYYELAETFFQLRDIENAKEYYLKCLELAPDFAPAINHLAYCYSHMGDHDKALELFEKYLQIELTANAYDSYGDGLMARGESDKAIEAKKKGISLDPSLDYLYSSLAYIQKRVGMFEDARENLSTHFGMQTTPQTQALGLTNKAYLLFIEGDIAQSLELCLEAKNLYDVDDIVSGNHRLHWLLARIYILQGNISEAQNEFFRMDSLILANGINPQNYNEILKFHKHLEVLLDNSKIEEISNYFDHYINYKIKDWGSPYDLAYFNTELGILSMRLGQTEEAIERFKKAIDYNSSYAYANYYLAQIYSDLNEEELASKHSDRFEETWKGSEISLLNH
ncbi:MAG: protein kinase [Bacteroidales bacterium]